MLSKLIRITLPTLLGLFLLGEAFIRVFDFIQFSAGTNNRSLMPDDQIGWVPKPDHGYVGTVKDLGGVEYTIEYSTNEFGFRLYGDINSQKTKVFIVGDSFTHATNVSNYETYYHYLKNDFEVFAIGASGHNPYQEWLTIKRHWEKIDPDIIVWQLCPNDIIDSLWKLDKIQYMGGITYNRPYLEKEHRVQWTSDYSGWFRAYTNFSFSRLIYVIGQKILQAKSLQESIGEGKGLSLVDRLRKEGNNLDGYDEGIENLRLVFKKLIEANRLGLKVYTFTNDPSHPFGSSLKKLSQDLGFHYLEGVDMTLRSIPREKRKEFFAADDYHWNKNGHLLVGEMMAYELKTSSGN